MCPCLSQLGERKTAWEEQKGKKRENKKAWELGHRIIIYGSNG